MTIWRRVLRWVMNHRPTKVIVVAGRPLFFRSYLFRLGPWIFFLHHYLRSDPDGPSRSGLHNHPMRAFVFILAGGYLEERLLGLGLDGLVTDMIPRRPGRVFHINEHAFHRLVIPFRAQVVSDSGGVRRRVMEQQTSWSVFASKYVPGKMWGFLSHKVDEPGEFRYVEAGSGIDDNEPWWKTAPNGSELAWRQES